MTLMILIAFTIIFICILRNKVLLPSIQKKQMEGKFYQMAYYDQLTNLPNRALFFKSMEEFIIDAKTADYIIVLLYLDFDRFKLINDIVGHDAGDQFLKEISEKIKLSFNEDTIIARLGGDEFGIILTDVKDDNEIKDNCRKILKIISSRWTYANNVFKITASIGIAAYPRDGRDAATLLKNADIAMYRAKELGQNRYEFYSPNLSEKAREQISMENLLMKAIDNDEFILYYQPQFNIITRECTGIEALIRWNSPQRGMIPPGKFIPFAEQNSLIMEIDKWVLKAVCKQCRIWEDLDIRPKRVAINISSKQFENTKFLSFVKKTLEETKADASWLEFEITEGSIMQNPDKTIETLTRLRELGIRIALDDFGTGYSSLGYLSKFPIDKIKIDKTFVKDIPENKEDIAIVKTIIDLCKNIGSLAMAEGVEKEEQLKVLSNYGCDEVQGYLFGRPVPLEEIEKMLKYSSKAES
ncbi:bifunctional diguanylate cyclase/phosphodiesterase [Clostridium sp. OS1-26]|uniref:putative bifunctional diguanylate cyclase/phosphodiesterase n=1 Tax=Clostridium sp. OS1-26 TaxID=3070681 RepID=UPI0027E04B03|nr:bifunctional diguanylate cyclase/phosphodiesterase [Clostridium sp. OS1-26]WML36727.1 bifunctional diguanylate cyclase/phosphodiesterase [Clostridium sp. OS1-26]